jgi:hypothetical protein
MFMKDVVVWETTQSRYSFSIEVIPDTFAIWPRFFQMDTRQHLRV